MPKKKPPAKRVSTQEVQQGNQTDATNRQPVDKVAAGIVDEEIRPGAGGILTSIPSESIYEDVDLGDEVDLAKHSRKKIRKPGRREWIVLNRESEYQSLLLVHRPGKDDIEKVHYWVHPNLRTSEIRDELKGHRIFLYYSCRSKAFRLWPVPVTEGNTWYESLDSLLSYDTSWFQAHEIKVIPDQHESEYRVRARKIGTKVSWPTKPMDELLAETLGPERVITVADHPVYQEIIAGDEVRLD